LTQYYDKEYSWESVARVLDRITTSTEKDVITDRKVIEAQGFVKAWVHSSPRNKQLFEYAARQFEAYWKPYKEEWMGSPVIWHHSRISLSKYEKFDY